MSGLSIGVDIGGTKIDAVVVNAAGDTLARHRIDVRRGAAGVVAAATEAVTEVCAQAGIAPDEAERVGVGIPGTVTAGVVRHAMNLDIEELDLGTALEREWRVPVVIENDVNAAAVGAMHVIGHGATSVAYLNVGTGLATGIILDGHLWRGARGAAGEIGHISIDPEGPIGPDGMPGGLETYASGSGIVLQWGVEGATALDVIEAARAGDPKATEIRDRLFEGLAHAVRIVVLTFDVEHVLVGGGLTGMGDELLDGARAVIREWEAASPFLASLDMTGRVAFVPENTPIAAIGAARLEASHG